MKLTLITALLTSYCPATTGFAPHNIKASNRRFHRNTHQSSTVKDTSSDDVEFSVGSLPQNPFLPLLSKGLHRVSLAMDKSTSDQLFASTASLQRLRQQIVKQTYVDPSSLGEKAGLGLFASKNIKVSTD